MEKLNLKLKSSREVEPDSIVISRKLFEYYSIQDNVLNFRTKQGSFKALQILISSLDDDYCIVNSETFDLLEISEEKKENELTIKENIMLGCDPEFYLLYKGFILNASNYFSPHGSIGSDGQLMELRPSPAFNEAEVTRNLYDLINKTRSILNNMESNIDPSKVEMVAASCIGEFAAGFHLHYSLPSYFLNKRHEVNRIAKYITRILDYYVAIPAIIPEGSNSKRRHSALIQYGKPGCYRINDKTLEFRVPGGILLKHPTLTQGLIGLGAVVVEDIMNRLSIYTDSYNKLEKMKVEDIRKFYPNIVPVFKLFEVVCSSTTDEALNLVPKIFEDVQKMIGYEKRKNSIDNFFNFINSSLNIGNNIEENWRQHADTEGSLEVFSSGR